MGVTEDLSLNGLMLKLKNLWAITSHRYLYNARDEKGRFVSRAVP
jgi:hypothetical protein